MTSTFNKDTAKWEGDAGGPTGTTGGADAWNGPFTTDTSVAPDDFLGGLWRGCFNTNAGEVTLTLDAGIQDGSILRLSNMGSSDLNILAATGETITGASQIKMRSFETGELAKRGNDWVHYST